MRYLITIGVTFITILGAYFVRESVFPTLLYGACILVGYIMGWFDMRYTLKKSLDLSMSKKILELINEQKRPPV